jgi:GNAT superfamily N-acetyltransferase
VTVRWYGSAREFLAEAEVWLSIREAENNLILGLALDLARQEAEGVSTWGTGEQAPWFLTVWGESGLEGCALRTPPHPALFSRLPARVARAVAGEVRAADPLVDGIMAAEEEGEAFCDAWREITGVDCVAGMGNILHDLTELIPPPRPAPGHLRIPGEDEVELLRSWMGAFIRETHLPAQEDSGKVVRRLWEDLRVWDHRGPRSMAAVTGRTPRTARIGYVYTPPEDRGRGFASAAVAQLTSDCLALGIDHCVLYTDEANPTSNAIYRRLGYRPVTTVRYFQLRP